MGSAVDRTPTARTTARSKATTPANASSCVENSTDTTATSTNTYRRGDSGRKPDAEEGAGRKVNTDSNRTQTTRARVGVGSTRRSSRERRRQDTDPGLAGMRTPCPEDVATTGIILRAGAAEAGARASGRCHRLIFRRIRRRIFRPIFFLDNYPTHRGTRLRQIIPSRTNTWETRGGGQQRSPTDGGVGDSRAAAAAPTAASGHASCHVYLCYCNSFFSGSRRSSSQRSSPAALHRTKCENWREGSALFGDRRTTPSTPPDSPPQGSVLPLRKRNECSCRGTDLVSWGAETSSMRGWGAWRRAKVHRHTTPRTGGRAGAAIGRLGRRGGECRSGLCRASPRGRMSTQVFC